MPLPLDSCFTYSLPEGSKAKVGCRVIVPFGAKKFYTALIVNIHDQKPDNCNVKEILSLLDINPVVLSGQLNFWRWIRDYYFSTMGDVLKAALPSGMKLESESRLVANPDFVAEKPLSEKEQKVIDFLASAKGEMSLAKLERETGVRNILTVAKALLDKGGVMMKEEIKANYRPKTEARLRLAPQFVPEKAFILLLDSLNRAPKQQEVLLRFIEKAVCNVLPKRALADCSQTALAALVNKGILQLFSVNVSRLRLGGPAVIPEPLSEQQLSAFNDILTCFNKKNVCLLHGVTASGKTQIYIHLINLVIKQGKQALYLLPEIALTTQVADRLKRVFGDRLGVYHSKFPDAERVEIWQKQISDKPYDVILGVRSSVFLPFKNLGLVIVDEEHETSYKQQEPAPRYHARNAAIMLAAMTGAKTLLGSATPSVDSYFNAQCGKYGLVVLGSRFRDITLPEIVVVDIKELARKKQMTEQFSPFLLEKMRDALNSGEQIILFQNRRGFSPVVECHSCGWVKKCDCCDVSLTYHKFPPQLVCHYCGNVYPVPVKCPACEGTDMRSLGFGTEKVEENIKGIFPNAVIARLDLDSAKTRAAYERIIDDFENGKTDILIGTQMVSKGLDFDRVSVVGILNADSMLSFPDFRAYERAYQLMAQVAGRAGRKNKRGLVVLQTKQPDLELIHQVVENDYGAMYSQQLTERRAFVYPPFCRLLYIFLKHPDENILEMAANMMAHLLKKVLWQSLSGPLKPPVERVKGLFIRKIIIKMNRGDFVPDKIDYLIKLRDFMVSNQLYRKLTVYYDMDPI